ncbi:hypothetical protein D5018_16955 [Parashewanella curva]|uniref:Death domain-containing protein n=2 Tax=Parashewanella curva TaxID=2338552 RepID=A0A3L8PSY9_9GAMM|nr:hypothetical protein D5018_16955 [Parashewanella curva]
MPNAGWNSASSASRTQSQVTANPVTQLDYERVCEITALVPEWRDISPFFGLNDVDEANILSAAKTVQAQRNELAKAIINNPDFNIEKIKNVFRQHNRMDIVGFINGKLEIDRNYFTNRARINSSAAPSANQAAFDQEYRVGELETENQRLRSEVEELNRQVTQMLRSQEQLQTQNNELRTSLAHTNSEIERRVEQKLAKRMAQKEQDHQHQISSLSSQLEKVTLEKSDMEQQMRKMRNARADSTLSAQQADSSASLVIPSEKCDKKIDSHPKLVAVMGALTNAKVTDLWESFGAYLSIRGTTPEIKQAAPHGVSRVYLMDLLRNAQSKVGGSRFSLQKIIDSLKSISEPEHDAKLQSAIDNLFKLQQEWR